MDVQVKLIELENDAKRLRERHEKAEARCAKTPTDHNRYLADCAMDKLLEAENKLAALQVQVEIDKGAQDEKTKRDDEESADIITGLEEYFGADHYEKLVEDYGNPVEPTSSGWVLNDVFFGRALFLGRTMLFSPGYQEFYEYRTNNGLWTPVTEDKLTHQLHTMLVNLNRRVFKKTPTMKSVNEKFRHAAIQSQHGSDIENKAAFIKKKPQHVQVANGVIAFTGGKVTLEKFDPQYYSLHASPLSYNPEATCPKFEALMQHLQLADIDAIKRAAGMFLIGRNIAQKIFVFED
jgi:hypothetical protein